MSNVAAGRYFRTPLFLNHGAANAALDVCMSVFEGGAKVLRGDSPAENRPFWGGLPRVTPGRQPTSIGPADSVTQPTAAALVIGSPELSRLGSIRPLASLGHGAAREAVHEPADPSA